MRFSAVLTGILLGLAAPAIAQQSLADQKEQADLDKVRADTAKVLLDTQKAKIDLDAATLAPLKGLGGGTATVSAGDKTVEAMLLGKAVTAGAAAKLVNVLTVNSVPTTVTPFIVIGTTPPSVNQWRIFESERDMVKANLETAFAEWNKVNSTKKGAGLIGIATIAATIVPLLKTDTTLTGANLSIEAVEAEAAIYKALEKANYPIDFSRLELMDGKTATDDLMAPLDQSQKQASGVYKEFLRLSQNRRVGKVQVAGANLKAALDNYTALKKGLMTETNGIMSATVVKRQKTFSKTAANRPILYLTDQTLAFTSTTKKSLFTGFTSTPAFGSAAAVFDYAMVGSFKLRGSVSCVIRKRGLSKALELSVETMPATGVDLCE